MSSYWICNNLIESQILSIDNLESIQMQPFALSYLSSPVNSMKKKEAKMCIKGWVRI